MHLIYSNHPALNRTGTKSLFLVGPTPRNYETPSWRPKAIEILEQAGYDGTVCVAEPATGERYPDYDDQVAWEFACLENCQLIVAWVPREMQHMPALTTNVEFGFWMGKAPQKVLYGRPDSAPHTKYLDTLYRKHNGGEPFADLELLLRKAVEVLR